ncbi:MAG: hypothetical protein KJ043_01070 [Anaerolineae bacterium]|nr:hypothetical protein [Anaerolineae bacterium]
MDKSGIVLGDIHADKSVWIRLTGLSEVVASYIALKFLHRSVTPEAVKDIFLLGVHKGVEGLTDVAKRVSMPFELDDKFIGAIAREAGRYFAEIGYTPIPTKPTHPPTT